jgi:hypothetical protein
MRIVHRISQTLDVRQQARLRELGIVVETGLITFEIDETNPSWAEVEKLVAEWKALDVVRTEFSKIELSNAKMLRMGPSWHHGYPEPSDDMGFLKETYVESSVCKICGSGKVQQHSFRLKQEPKWGNKHVLQLNWVFDEFFVQPETWRDVFQPFGIACREVLHVKTGKPLETIVQLCIDEIATAELSIDEDLEVEPCKSCGVVKYAPIVRGEFPGLKGENKSSMMKTKEVFGSGASSWRAILVSSELFRSITEAKLKGVEFIPTSMKKSKVPA